MSRLLYMCPHRPVLSKEDFSHMSSIIVSHNQFYGWMITSIKKMEQDAFIKKAIIMLQLLKAAEDRKARCAMVAKFPFEDWSRALTLYSGFVDVEGMMEELEDDKDNTKEGFYLKACSILKRTYDIRSRYWIPATE